MKWRMKVSSRSRSSVWHFRPRVRGLCQACGTTSDVVNPNNPVNKNYVEPIEINHKEIRRNALQLMKKGEITKEEYILVVDADLKYEAGLNIDNIVVDIETPPPSCESSGCLSSCPSIALVEHAKAFYSLSEGTKDPITYDELGENVFIFVTPLGHKISYNIESLVEYIASSGDFRDPVSRFLLSTEDIQEIDRQLMMDDKFKHLSTLKSIRENSHRYCVEKQKKEECQNLQTCLGEMIVEMLDIIEKPCLGPKTTEQAEMRMFSLLSEFDSPFKLLKTLDIEQGRQCLMSWIIFLQGPEKRPTKVKGPRGILKTAVEFLEGQWTQTDDDELKKFQAKFAK